MSESLEELDNKLNAYLIKNGVPMIEPSTDYDKYINMTPEDLRSLNGTNAEDVAYMMEQCALNVQKLMNRLNAKLIYVNGNLNKSLSLVYDTYKTYGGPDIVTGMARNEHKVIDDLYTLKMDLEIEIEEVKFLGKHISNMATRVSNMKWRGR